MTIDKFNFAGKKAIVRVDFNVPLDENGHITDDTRIRGALPTLKKILNDGGSLIIMSHMGKPKGKVNAKFSLSQIKDDVAKALGRDVKFVSDCVGPDAAAAAADLKPGEVLLLENLRFHPEEEGKPVGIDKEDPAYDAAKKQMKEQQKEFAKTLASYADVYVNDAFGTAHRKHASTAVIADYFNSDDKMLGYLMEKEVNAVDKILSDIQRPFTAIMGGSKVSTKIGIIENLMDKVDNLILCGGMTYTFAKAHGRQRRQLRSARTTSSTWPVDIMQKAKEKGVNLVLGTDCVAADAFSNDCQHPDLLGNGHSRRLGRSRRRSRDPQGFRRRYPRRQDHTLERPCRRIRIRQLHRRHHAPSPKLVVEATNNGAFSLVGGGDSVACVNKFGLADEVCVCIDRRRRSPRSYRGQGAPRRSSHSGQIIFPT